MVDTYFIWNQKFVVVPCVYYLSTVEKTLTEFRGRNISDAYRSLLVLRLCESASRRSNINGSYVGHSTRQQDGKILKNASLDFSHKFKSQHHERVEKTIDDFRFHLLEDAPSIGGKSNIVWIALDPQGQCSSKTCSIK